MPTSDPAVIPVIVNKLFEFSPKTILDVGVGFGKWGVLCREYMEIWQNHKYKKEKWKTTIDGIEIFKNYWNPMYEFIYNNVWFGNVMDFLENMKFYGVVLLIDVLEHLSKVDGVKLLESIPNHYIVSTPNGFTNQGAKFGNEHETHISSWQDYGFTNKIIVGNQIVAWK